MAKKRGKQANLRKNQPKTVTVSRQEKQALAKVKQAEKAHIDAMAQAIENPNAKDLQADKAVQVTEFVLEALKRDLKAVQATVAKVSAEATVSSKTPTAVKAPIAVKAPRPLTSKHLKAKVAAKAALATLGIAVGVACLLLALVYTGPVMAVAAAMTVSLFAAKLGLAVLAGASFGCVGGGLLLNHARTVATKNAGDKRPISAPHDFKKVDIVAAKPENAAAKKSGLHFFKKFNLPMPHLPQRGKAKSVSLSA